MQVPPPERPRKLPPELGLLSGGHNTIEYIKAVQKILQHSGEQPGHSAREAKSYRRAKLKAMAEN